MNLASPENEKTVALHRAKPAPADIAALPAALARQFHNARIESIQHCSTSDDFDTSPLLNAVRDRYALAVIDALREIDPALGHQAFAALFGGK